MGLPRCTQRLEEAPLAISNLFIYTKTSLQISVLNKWSATEDTAGLSTRVKVHMRKNHHTVFSEMQICL